MGNIYTKIDTSEKKLDIEEVRSVEELRALEDKYDKYESDGLKQYFIIEKNLIDDELAYAKDLEEYRTKHNTYVVTDRELIKRAGDIMLRKMIVWN